VSRNGATFAYACAFALLLGALGCSTSTLDAVRRKPVTDGGVPDGQARDGRVADLDHVEAGSDAQLCPQTPLSPGDSNETIQVGSLSRSYFLHVPPSYDGSKPVPLVLDFHFLGNSGAQEQYVSPYPKVTDGEGVIVVFPDGWMGPSGTAWNMGPCCVASTVDDVAFARAIVTQLASKACIDSKRIYAVGFGVGGGMAHYLGCHAADLFAAVSPVSFDLLKENVAGCTPVRPITVVSFRELSDGYAPYPGGPFTTVSGMSVTLLGAEATFSKWAEIDQCTGSPVTDEESGCSTYKSCADSVEVVLCTRQAGVPVPDNASIAWPILKRHPLP
jgi:polyhydroxybutyrate depolymerase